MAKPGYRLALFATALALLVVLLGAYTRLTHAGLGCPDWPGCYGFIGVPQSAEQLAHAEQHYPQAPVEVHKGWNEMVHRYFAGSLGLLILALAIQALRRRREPGQPLKLPLLLLGLVTLQAAFGMWTVTLKLWPQVVTAHLLGGFATLSLLLLLTLRLSARWPALLLVASASKPATCIPTSPISVTASPPRRGPRWRPQPSVPRSRPPAAASTASATGRGSSV